MPETNSDRPLAENAVPVIDLSKVPGERAAWGRSKVVVYLWGAVELLFVTNPWQISSNLRVRALRLFGAEIGEGVIFRPRTRVKFPWKLSIGDRCWIGEGVWVHNQDNICIKQDAVISQDTFLTTGSHAHREDMALITSPIVINAGAWITARCIIQGGVVIGQSAILAPGTVVKAMTQIPKNSIFQGNPARFIGTRFE